MIRRLLPLLALLACAVPTPAQAPLPHVPDGFKAELVLAAPDIEAPTALAVAPNGDVYFAEDPMDMAGPPTQNLDQIWLLKGGDPKKKILFADKMWAVMGLEIVRDRMYCVHPPYVTVFTLDGEGKAKSRENLFTDLGPRVAGLPGFNDHVPSGIRMGMDGWLYVSIGDKGIPKMTRKEKDAGSVHVAEGRWRHTKEGNHVSLEGGGVIRFRPDGSGLEVFASGTRNHLDVPLDEHDRIFVRDNTDDGLGWWTRLMYLPPGAFMGYPWAYRQRPSETLPMIRDFGGGSPCGGWVYCDDGLPETYRGRVFHCEWGQGKVLAVKLAPDGGGFKFVDQISFMDTEKSGLKDFRPFTLRPTADGRGFYVTDWGYSGWSAKVKAGRLWKVTYAKEDVKPAPRGKDTDGVEELIKALDHPAHSERLRAQRALVAEGKKAAEEVEKRITDGKLTPRQMRHALWVIGTHAAPDWPNVVLPALEAKDADVRLEAARVLGSTQWRFTKTPGDGDAGTLGGSVRILERFADRIKNEKDPQVRLQVAVAWRLRNGRLPVLALATEQDVWVRQALIRNLKQNCDWMDLAGQIAKDNFLKDKPQAVLGLCQALAETFDEGAVEVLHQLLKDESATTRRQAVEALSRNYADRKPYAGGWWGTQPAGQQPPARVVKWNGTPAVRDLVVKALDDRDPAVRKAAVGGLATAKDAEALEPLRSAYQRTEDVATKVDILRALTQLPNPGVAELLIDNVSRPEVPEPIRLESVSALAQLRPANAGAALAAVIVSPKEPAALQIRALEALGNMKAKETKPAAAGAIKSTDPAVRKAAATALGTLGDPSAAELLLPALKDGDGTVQSAAIQALGVIKARDAIPALVGAAEVEATKFDAITGLTRMPDKRALSAYLAGLQSKNQTLRQASAQAIAAVREEVTPALEQLIKRNEVPAAVLPELRNIYNTFAPIMTWQLIGPFPADGKAYAPEKDTKLDREYDGAGKKVKWLRDRKADANQNGRVNLHGLFAPNENVVAYGYAEFESDTDRDAQLQIGSDDTIVVWVNGKKVHEYNGNRGWAPNQDKANVKLVKGKNTVLVKCGNASGPWDFSVAVSGNPARYAFLQGGEKKVDLEAFRDFARKTRGDSERGRRLFSDLKGLACMKCHAVGGEGGKVGPDLAGIALRYGKEELMTSILEPSRTIAQGYETVEVLTSKGVALKGVFKGDSGDAINLADAEGKVHSIAKKDVEEKSFSPVSMMPNGLSDGMSLQDFADLVAFLEARREEKK